MLRRAVFQAAAILLPIAGYAQAGLPDQCDGQRPLPFANIEVRHSIDQTCGIKGKPSASANSQLQNAVKNNFCAVLQSGGPERYTPEMLAQLQAQTHIPSGQGHEPTDRQPLKDLGEGKVIRMKAFLIEAHHADLGSGESVNCNDGTEEGNDVHIAFGPAPDTRECDSVVTGQLFFDASHAPCPCGTSCSPVRASLWEIHPVYAIEVCLAGTTCQEDVDVDWLPFDKWWNSLAPLQPTRPPHRHAPHEPVAASAAH
jgi:hypothetical protein